MNTNYFLLIVVLLAIGTFCIRAFFIVFSSRLKISADVRRLFTYVPAAIFPAIIVPSAFFHQGAVEWVAGKERFLVLMLSGILCYFVRNTLAVVSFGLILLYLIRFTL